jgi:uncharacterized protein (DUF433 family)
MAYSSFLRGASGDMLLLGRQVGKLKRTQRLHPSLFPCRIRHCGVNVAAAEWYNRAIAPGVPSVTPVDVMSTEKVYVQADENGVYRVGKTRVMLDSVVAAFRQGHSPETIKQQYPALTLEEVYGSIAYYLAHAAEIDAYLKRQEAVWQQWKARCEAQPSAVVERLRALAKAGAPEAP